MGVLKETLINEFSLELLKSARQNVEDVSGAVLSDRNAMPEEIAQHSPRTSLWRAFCTGRRIRRRPAGGSSPFHRPRTAVRSSPQ